MGGGWFEQSMEALAAYLHQEKRFVENKPRRAELDETLHMARLIFPRARIGLLDDPLQLGAMTIAIDDADLSLFGKEQIKQYGHLLDHADTVAVYPIGDLVRLELQFCHVLLLREPER